MPPGLHRGNDGLPGRRPLGGCSGIPRCRRLGRTPITSLAAVALRIGRRVEPYLLATAFLAGLALASFAFWSKSDLDLFRWPMAELALHGHPLFIYTVRDLAE